MEIRKSIDSLLKAGLSEHIYPGAVLLIADEADILHFQTCGYACLTPEEEIMSHDTIFDLASLAKVLATVPAVMHLMVEKRMALDDPVCEYLPDFCPKSSGGKTITSRHLLTHSSGLEAWRPFYKEILEKRIPLGTPAREHIIEIICDLPLIYPTGERSVYSDLDFILLGHLMEKTSGCTLEEFCAEKIFQPLGMNRTFFGSQLGADRGKFSVAATEFSDWRGGIIQGQVHDENAYVMGGAAGHAGLFSTAEDILIFSRNIILSLKNERGFWPKSLMKEFVSRQNLPPGSSWALGWDTPSPVGSTSGQFFSPYSIGHTGFTGTSVWIDLEDRLIIIFLTNRVHPSRSNETIRAFRPLLHNTIREVLGR